MADDKKPEKKKKTLHVNELYEVHGTKLSRKNKFCPKCGPGFFLAKHKNRESCGKCHYTVFGEKKE